MITSKFNIEEFNEFFEKSRKILLKNFRIEEQIAKAKQGKQTKDREKANVTSRAS